MKRLPIVVALSLLAAPAVANRPYESSRPELNQVDRPESHKPEVDTYKPGDIGRDHGSQSPAVRPDPRGGLVLPSREGVDRAPTISGSNVEVSHGKPNLRPDPHRDAFAPVNETTGIVRGIGSHPQIAKGKPNLRPDAKRDAFVPVDETTGLKRGLGTHTAVSKGKPDLRPEPHRDAFRPAREEAGATPTNPASAICAVFGLCE